MNRNHSSNLAHFAFLPVMALVACVYAAPSFADFKTMAQRLPTETDAVIAINLAKVLETPYAREHKWADNVADAWARKPVMVPPGSRRLLMAAGIRPGVMESAWELSMVEMTALPPLESLMSGEGGHIDRVWDRNAVVSPVNAYFVPMENNVLASFTPADRQAVTRWVRTPAKPEGNLRSAYLREIAAALNDDTHIMLAIDLEGAISAPKAHKAMLESDMKELQGRNLDGVASALSTIRGASLSVRVDQRLLARAVIEFGKDISSGGSLAKPLTLAALERADFAIPDAAAWTFSVNKNQIIAEGELSDSGLRLLTGLIQTPVPAVTVASTGTSSSGAAPPVPAAPLEPGPASARYYKSVSGIIDSLRAPTSMSAGATALRQAAKRIDQLPILKVDPMLVEWGTMVSFKMKQATGISAATQSTIDSRVAGERSSEYGVYRYDSGGEYAAESWAYASHEAVRQRSQSSAMQTKAQGQKEISALVNDLSTSRGQVRAKMVAKYNIEF